MNLELSKSNVTDVKETETLTWIFLEFRIQSVPYSLQINKNSKQKTYFEPINVVHDSDMECPFCKKMYGKYKICSALSKETINLFEFLTSQNHIRLNWLFRDILTKETNDVL